MNKYNRVMDKVTVSADARRRILENIEKEIIESENSKTPLEGEKEKKSRKIIRFINYYGARAAVFVFIAVGAYAVIRTVGFKSSQETSAPESAIYETASEPVAEEEAETAGQTMTFDNSLEPELAQENDSYIDGEAVAETNDAAEIARDDDKSMSIQKRSGEEMARPEDMDNYKIRAGSVTELSHNLGYSVKEVESLSESSKNVEYYYSTDGAEIIYESPYGVINLYVSDDGAYLDGKPVDSKDYDEIRYIDTGTMTVSALGENGSYGIVYWTDDGITYVLAAENGITEDEVKSLF